MVRGASRSSAEAIRRCLLLTASLLFASGSLVYACEWCALLGGGKPRTGSYGLMLQANRTSYSRIEDVRLSVVLINHGNRPVFFYDQASPLHVLSCHIANAQVGVSENDLPIGAGDREVAPGQKFNFGSSLGVPSTCESNARRAGSYSSQ